RTFSAARGTPHPNPTVVGLAAALGGIQWLGFAAMEAFERTAAGAPLAGMFLHNVFLIGLLFQALTALFGALVLIALCRAATGVGAALARPETGTRAVTAPFG